MAVISQLSLSKLNPAHCALKHAILVFAGGGGGEPSNEYLIALMAEISRLSGEVEEAKRASALAANYRNKIHEEKQNILRNLVNTTKQMNYLELQLRR